MFFIKNKTYITIAKELVVKMNKVSTYYETVLPIKEKVMSENVLNKEIELKTLEQSLHRIETKLDVLFSLISKIK